MAASAQHIGVVDAERWPSIAEVPSGLGMSWRANRAEAQFATACEQAGLELEGSNPDLRVLNDAMFNRIAVGGWLGIAEAYMAGEWESASLVKVLTRLLEINYAPKARRANFGTYDGVEVPPALIRLTSGDGISAHGAMFASGVATTERVSVPSYVPGAGKGHEPANHFVDVTNVSPPSVVERADLREGQLRATSGILDMAEVLNGCHMLDFPSSGATLAAAASQRQAIIDAISADMDQVLQAREYLKAAKVEGSVHIELHEHVFPAQRLRASNYDAVTVVEKFELMGTQARKRCIQLIDSALTTDGHVGFQSVVATDALTQAADQALDVCRAYLWPALQYCTMETLHQDFDTVSNLRIVAQRHFGSHYVQGLALMRETFEAQLREAAAEGFDPVYRRMWIYQLALREALFRCGMLDAVQCRAIRRSRRRRR